MDERIEVPTGESLHLEDLAARLESQEQSWGHKGLEAIPASRFSALRPPPHYPSLSGGCSILL